MSHLPVPYDLGVSVPDFSANLVRGALIGAAETIPGVSGGTVALITGIYSRLIAAGKHLTDVGRAFITRGDWRAEFRRIDWRLLGPVALGAVVIASARMPAGSACAVHGSSNVVVNCWSPHQDGRVE